MQAKPTNELKGNMAMAVNGDTKVFRIVRGGGYAEKVADCELAVVGMDGVGYNMNTVDDDVGGPEGVTDAGKA